MKFMTDWLWTTASTLHWHPWLRTSLLSALTDCRNRIGLPDTESGGCASAAEKDHVKGYIEGLNLLSSMRLCSNVPAQSIVQTSLGGYQSADELLLPGGRIYEQREYIYNALCDIPGVSVVKPKAAFYIFPKLDEEKKFHIKNDEQFALDLLRDKKILITCGTGFNCTDTNHFRIVFLPNIVQLKTAMGKIADFFKLLSSISVASYLHVRSNNNRLRSDRFDI